MISMTFALLQAEGGAMGSYGGIIMIVALFAIMYFFREMRSFNTVPVFFFKGININSKL